MFKQNYFIFFVCFSIFMLMFCCGLYSQNDSTSKPTTLNTIEIKVDSIKDESANSLISSIPVSVLNEKEIKLLNANNVASLVQYLPSVQVKDYGGVGGVKTISIKGLGAQYNKVVYNGFPLLSSQNGIADLGKIPSQNIKKITLSEGGNVSKLQTAQSYASGNVLAIESNISSEDSYVANLGYGSFNHVIGGLFINKNINKWNINVFYQYECIDANYPFVQENGNYDTILHRINSQVLSHNVFLTINRFWNKQKIQLTSNFNTSTMGLPGPVILYNNVSSNQFQENSTTFTQLKYENNVKKKFKFSIYSKYDFQWLSYLDTTTVLTGDIVENTYKEETFLNSFSGEYYLNKIFKLYSAIDVNYSFLNSSTSNISPNRTSVFEVLGSKINFNNRFLVDVNLLLNQNIDNYDGVLSTKTFINPFIGVVYHPSWEKRIAVKASFKQTFIMPTFNNLYYVQVGNRDLDAETANIANIGFVIKSNQQNPLQQSFTANTFYSVIDDKIVTIPTQNLFYWQTLNYGKVENMGIDFQYNVKFDFNKSIKLKFDIQYTYQKNIDVTDETSNTYLNQIPYTPNHLGAIVTSIKYGNIELGHTFQYTGDRYYILNNDSRYLMPSYGLQNISILYSSIKIKKFLIDQKVELNNITNNQYQIINNYPMYGRNYMLKINIKL